MKKTSRKIEPWKFYGSFSPKSKKQPPSGGGPLLTPNFPTEPPRAKANPAQDGMQAPDNTSPEPYPGRVPEAPAPRPDEAQRGFTSDELSRILADAKDAISRGASRDDVAQRLRDHGIDPAGLDDA